MPHDTGISNRLRAKGLRVVEVAGWRTRGSSYFHPRGSVDHHTAGSSQGKAPSLNVCIYGRAGLSGPLANILVARDNTCYVIAAGRANHAGKGSWRGLVGNSSVYGVERENVGYASREPWRNDQTVTAAKVHAALMEGKDPDLVCEHKEWTTRKIDAHTITGATMRSMVMRYSGVPTPPTEPDTTENDIKEADMYIAVDGVGFFAQVGSVTVPLVGVSLADFGALTASNKSVGVLVIPKGSAEDFLSKSMLQTVAATTKPV